jgi:hypothetical protein
MNELDVSALESLIDAYCTAWSEPDSVRRKQIIDAVWADAATYTDPNVELEGAEALAAHIDRVIARRPGACVIRTSAVDSHHNLARFLWKAMLPDGSSLVDGIDFAEISEAGKLRRIVGFFGSLA